MDVAIIGAGITGLTLAYELEKQLPEDAKIYLFEKDDKIGGKIQTTQKQGYLIEEGPDGFVRSKTALIELAKKLAIENDLIQPAVNSFYIKKNGKLRTVPAGMGSMVPSDLFGFLTTNLLSTSGKVRMVRERLIPPKKNNEDESLASFFERRFGPEVLENLAEP